MIDLTAGQQQELNRISGVVTCGLFARRAADMVISAGNVRKNR